MLINFNNPSRPPRSSSLNLIHVPLTPKTIGRKAFRFAAQWFGILFHKTSGYCHTLVLLNAVSKLTSFSVLASHVPHLATPVCSSYSSLLEFVCSISIVIIMVIIILCCVCLVCRTFESAKQLGQHVTKEHFETNLAPVQICRWSGCDNVPRQRWSLMTHLQVGLTPSFIELIPVNM